MAAINRPNVECVMQVHRVEMEEIQKATKRGEVKINPMMNSPLFAAVHNGGSHSAHLSRASSDTQLASVQDAPDSTALFHFLASSAA